MSSIYNTEPQPTASVILHTNHGDLSVELFAKQTPLTSRNFLQHCLDGYYDNTIFHRLVPGFILQGGDPTGTGNGGESIYDRGAFSGDLDPWPMDQRRGKNAGPTGVNFRDEFHSRLKFNRRGLLGMANEGTVDSNGSQFFFTLDKTAELDGKNTMFGRVAGDTIYNLAKMGEAELDEGSERPLYPTKITSVEILVNPFDGMKKRERVAQRTSQPAVPAKKKDKKRKGGKQLLSFGDEEGDGDIQPLPKKPKFDTRIVMMDTDEDEAVPPRPKKAKTVQKGKDTSEPTDLKTNVPIREAPVNDSPSREPSPPPNTSKQPSYKAKVKVEVKVKDEVESSPEPEPSKHKSELDRTNEEIAAIKASLKKTIQSSEPVQHETKKSALEQMIPETSTRGRKRRPGGNNPSAAQERKALDFIKSFKSKLDSAPSEKATNTVPPATENKESKEEGGGSTVAGDDDEVCDLHFIANCQSCKAWDNAEAKDDSDDEGWMSHSLSFAADKLGKDLSYRKKAEEELIVIDPLEKARNLHAQRKEKGRDKTSARSWDDLAKNAQMARASSLAGRGAK